MKRSLVVFGCLAAISGCKSAGGKSQAKDWSDSTNETLQNDYWLNCGTSYTNYDGNDETEDLLYDAGKTVDEKEYDGSKWSDHKLDWTDSVTGVQVIAHARSYRYREFRGDDSYVRQDTEFQSLKVVLPDGVTLEAPLAQNPEDPDFLGYDDIDYATIMVSDKLKTPNGTAKDLTVACQVSNRSNDD